MRLTISAKASGNGVSSYQQGTSKKKRSFRRIEAFVFPFEVLNESKRKKKRVSFQRALSIAELRLCFVLMIFLFVGYYSV